MKVSHNWLQTYFDKPIPKAETLAELFNFHAFEVEAIETLEDNSVLDVKVLPDRAHYALSHLGIAREVSVIAEIPLKAGRIPQGPEATLTRKPEVRIEDTRFCRRYMARYAEVPSVAESNPHASAMLASIGQRAINSIVDATNIVMFDCGQPLHIFDADKVVGTIVIRSAREGEKILLLDSVAGADREVALLATDYVIADDEGPIAIAGVKGGKRAGVTAGTKHLIIESANFEPASVRRTSTRLNLRSESSKRYENEITPELTATGMNDVCSLLVHNISGATFGPIVDTYPTKQMQTIIDFNPAYITERLGVAVPEKEAKKILTTLGIVVTEKGASWNLAIPYERLDLTDAVDIIEEIGRIYGYDKIVSVLPPQLADVVPTDKTFYWSEKVKSILVEQGFSEVQTYTLIGNGDIEITYPLAKDKKALRTSLESRLVHTASQAGIIIDLLGLKNIKIFEIGKVFPKAGEKTVLGVAFTSKKDKKDDQYTESELFSNLANRLGFEDKKFIEEHIIKKTGLITTSVENSSVRKGSAVEIDIDSLISKLPEPGSLADAGFKVLTGKKYTPYSRYPFIARDIALFAPAGTEEGVVRDVIQTSLERTAKKLVVRGPDCFDRFEKGDKKSFAFRMIFQSFDRTLSDEEVGGFMEALYTDVKAQGWEVR